jgi:hypothetical protein
VSRFLSPNTACPAPIWWTSRRTKPWCKTRPIRTRLPTMRYTHRKGYSITTTSRVPDTWPRRPIPGETLKLERAAANRRHDAVSGRLVVLGVERFDRQQVTPGARGPLKFPACGHAGPVARRPPRQPRPWIATPPARPIPIRNRRGSLSHAVQTVQVGGDGCAGKLLR